MRESTHRTVTTTISLVAFAIALILLLGELPPLKRVWLLAEVGAWGVAAGEIRRRIGEDS